jgi:DNA replication protein DnaC
MMQTIAEIAGRVAPGAAWRTGSDAASGDVRELRPVRLGELDTRHHPLVKTAVDAARQWAARYQDGESKAPSLVLSGPNGTGKSHIARAIWWSITTAAMDDGGQIDAATRRPVGKFYLAAELLAMLSPDDEMRGQLPGVGQVIGAAPLVVIDDVGAEGVIQFVGKEYQTHERMVRYFRLVDWAYNNDVPLVLTTNLPLPELAGHVGPRAWDRLNEMAPAGQMVSLWGVPSWRVKAGGR